MTKYIFVTGGVLSSVGKGSVSASIGKILQVRNFSVTAIKVDPYLNVDAGTMNPFMHGEVFVCEDGGEMDLDLGTYERFLDTYLSRESNITTGQIYYEVIEKERRGDLLGQCVQIIPHVTEEIKHRIKQVAKKTSATCVLVECGGTVGDIEGLPFYEAFRQMRLDEGLGNTLIVHVALIPIIDVTKEQKSKPAQHSIQELRRIGLQPDIIVGRCRAMIDSETRRKLALFGSVEEKAVISSPTVECIYSLPLVLDEQGLGDIVCDKLLLQRRNPLWNTWNEIVNSMIHTKYSVKIALCGKYARLNDSYMSINEALKHAGAKCGANVNIYWIETETFEDDPKLIHSLKQYDGILVPGGFGSRGTEGKISTIRYARENDIPFLGICLGFQLASVEFARHVCGLKSANSTELDSSTPHPVVDLLPEQSAVDFKGGTMRLGASPIIIEYETLAFELYQSERIYERHRHRYEINPKYIPLLKKHGMLYSAKTPDGTKMEILELPDKYFFFGTQFHPEFKSRPGKPDPAYYGFIKSTLDKKMGLRKPQFSKDVSLLSNVKIND